MTDAEPYQIAAEVVADPGFAPELLHRLAHQALVEKVMRLDQQMASHMVAPGELLDHDQAFERACDQAPSNHGKPYNDVSDAKRAAAERQELVGFVAAYRELKRQRGCVEFADQQAAATTLAAAPRVGQVLRERFKVVLLDEYQDTSAAQAAMLASLFAEHPVSAVGDPLQAIYGWRGAASDNMGRFKSLFRPAGSAVYPLRINRRSGDKIVAVANAVASSMKAQPYDQPLLADPLRAHGLVEARLFATRPEEVAAVAARIVEAHQLQQAPTWADAAVLVRRNGDIAALYEALTDLDVPVEIVGLGGLLALPEIASVIAMLRLAADDADNPSAALLVSGPACGLGVRDMAALSRRVNELEESQPRLLDAVFNPGNGVSQQGRARLAKLAARVRSVRRLRHEPAADLIQIAADALGLTAQLAVPSPQSAAMAAQLRRLVGHVAEHSGRAGDVTLDGLLAWLAAESTHGDQLDQAAPSDDDSVKLLTVHKAKGLEWAVVALPGLNQNVFPNDSVGDNPLTQSDALPHELRLDAGSVPQLKSVTHTGFADFGAALKDQQVASEDRLGYVASSRAKTTLLASASYWWPGRKTASAPSRLFGLIAERADRLQLADAPSGPNPLNEKTMSYDWPPLLDDDQQSRLDHAAAAVMTRPSLDEARRGLSHEDARRVDGWRAAADALRAGASQPQVSMPASIAASALVAGRHSAGNFYADIARPMPRVSDPGAVRGSLFHEYLERRFRPAGGLPDDDDAPVPGGQDISQLVAAFDAGPYGQLVPMAVETPFVAVIAGQQVRGRIDAVYRQTGRFRYQIVDWKTSATMSADAAQLAVYRLAWAQMAGCDVAQVDAVFCYVAQGRVVRPAPLGQAQVEAWVTGLRGAAGAP